MGTINSHLSPLARLAMPPQAKLHHQGEEKVTPLEEKKIERREKGKEKQQGASLSPHKRSKRKVVMTVQKSDAASTKVPGRTCFLASST